jgi:uncharacterized protein (TIGR02996 family)
VLFVSVQEKGGEKRELEFDKIEVSIGRDGNTDICLPKGNISKQHARLVVKDGKCIIVDLKSTNGTYVNGRKITSPLVVRDDDKIYVGDFLLQFSITDNFDNFEDYDTAEVDATELRLLAAIAHHDEAGRLVYADWLEQQGYPDRAEFLRITEEMSSLGPDAPEFRMRSDRMRQLAASIDIHWRQKVARPAIENCVAFEFQCPKDWGELATTERGDVRYCGACAKRVHYCATVSAAQVLARRGECVAVDIFNIRRAGDLDPEPRPIRMGMIMPYSGD